MHPDKFASHSEEERDKAEEKFKEIQQAYEVLSNETQRRLYDSTDAFDDTLPMDCDPADFFKVREFDVAVFLSTCVIKLYLGVCASFPALCSMVR